MNDVDGGGRPDRDEEGDAEGLRTGGNGERDI